MTDAEWYQKELDEIERRYKRCKAEEPDAEYCAIFDELKAQEIIALKEKYARK